MTDELAFLGEDRGVRVLRTEGFAGYTRLHNLIVAYQRQHPDTIMLAHMKFDKSTRIGELTIKWWPRGTAEP